MGQLHNELRRGPLSVALKAALGDSRQGGLERYGETLTPTIDMWDRPEWALLRDEELWAVSQDVTAGGAGTFAKVGIFNPAASNLLVVVLLHSLNADTAARVNLYPLSAVLASTATVQMRDRRGLLSRGAVIHFEASAAAGADLMWQTVAQVSSLTPTVLELPLVLPPGRGFMWRSSDDAATITGSFIGYQRRGYPSELVSRT